METKWKILIVEDDQYIARFTSMSLRKEGYEVLEASTCAEALFLFSSHHPDIVLLDLGLPDRDGLDFLREIRAFSETPVLIVSARGQENEKIAALDLGANDYITKPFHMLPPPRAQWGLPQQIDSIIDPSRRHFQRRGKIPRAQPGGTVFPAGSAAGPERGQRLRQVDGDAERAVSELRRRGGLVPVEAGVQRLRVVPRHPPEGVLDDAGGVVADAQLQIEHPAARVRRQKGAVPVLRRVPTLILDKAIVGAQVHRHADANGDHCNSNDAQKPLLQIGRIRNSPQ